MENLQFEYFASANWNTLFEGGCKGGEGVGRGAFLIFGHRGTFFIQKLNIPTIFLFSKLEQWNTKVAV